MDDKSNQYNNIWDSYDVEIAAKKIQSLKIERQILIVSTVKFNMTLIMKMTNIGYMCNLFHETATVALLLF